MAKINYRVQKILFDNFFPLFYIVSMFYEFLFLFWCLPQQLEKETRKKIFSKINFRQNRTVFFKMRSANLYIEKTDLAWIFNFKRKYKDRTMPFSHADGRLAITFTFTADLFPKMD